MGNLLWVTDIHLNFRPDLQEIIEHVRSGCDGVLVTGDISEAPSLTHDLKEFQKSIGAPVYFVLGNHDFYRGSLGKVRTLVGKEASEGWLTQRPPVELSPGVVLTGHDGMYDARLGKKENSRLLMSDFHLIEEWAAKKSQFIGGYGFPVTTPGLIQKVREVADAWAQEAKVNLLEALKKNPTKILFATHYPPFSGACWHRGSISDGDWLPWFTSKAMGDVLDEVAYANPQVEFDVYCGHTHSKGTYNHRNNLRVFTGEADYGKIILNSPIHYLLVPFPGI